MPQVVQPDLGAAGFLPEAGEVSVEVARLHRGTDLGGEDQAVILPDLGEAITFPALALLVVEQRQPGTVCPMVAVPLSRSRSDLVSGRG